MDILNSLPHINYALVENTRPKMYAAMKYWGKKPHNIWSQFIERYCPVGGIVLDPFAGSAVAAFEAIKLGRKAIAFDLNPLSVFMIEVLTSDFDERLFLESFDAIMSRIEEDPVYIEHYTREIKDRLGVVSNYRWFINEVVNVAVELPSVEKAKSGKPKKVIRYFIAADEVDKDKAQKAETLVIPYWYPTDKFPNTPAISHKFVTDIGGNGFQYLWTKRNLYILSRIFHEIGEETNPAVRLQLLSAFIQTLHLTSKMVVPRNTKSNRDFSGSWGRADYMIRKRQMEQNPLVVFRRSCIDKQGILAALRDAKNTLPVDLKLNDINKTKRLKTTSNLTYGIVDIADLSEYLSEKSVDFVITDPPYAGLVPYLDLSLVWLVWLKHINSKYDPELRSEITIKKGQINRDEYRRRLQNAFQQLHRVLKDDGYIIITFHHRKIREWNDFVQAVRFAGFRFEKVTHQYNRRSGESNVANPYGTSGADFYIRCVKRGGIDFSNDDSGLEDFIVQQTISVIAQRNEPTPYDFVIAAVIPEMLQAGYMRQEEYKNEILRVLEKHSGEGNIFKRIINDDNKAGDYWWFMNPNEHINFPDRPLEDRVDETVLSILRRRVSVKLDDVLSELFRTYPNGLTPDPRSVTKILEQYAYRSAGKWKIKDVTRFNSTQHSEIIRVIAGIGKRAGYRIHIGKREQYEATEAGGILRDVADMPNLGLLKGIYNTNQIDRIEMIDLIWLASNQTRIECVFEVENSTKFTTAIVRGSNIEKDKPKFMIIPGARERELTGLRDPLFITSFVENNWRYISYEEIIRLGTASKPQMDDLVRIAKSL